MFWKRYSLGHYLKNARESRQAEAADADKAKKEFEQVKQELMRAKEEMDRR